MKKSVLYLLFLVAIFLAPSITSAQAEVRNSTNRVITLQSLNKDGEVTINPYKKGIVGFAGNNGALECYIFYYIGQSEVPVGKIIKTLNNGKCEITAGDLNGVSEKKEKTTKKVEEETPTKELKKTDKTSVKEPKEVGTKIDQGENVNNSRPTTTITIADSSDYSFVVISGQFSGLALSPMQKSDESHEVNTGQIQITIKHQTKKDKDQSTSGTVFKETVISKIITQGQECLTIKNEDFPVNTGEDMQIKMISLIPYEIVISAGPLNGTALGKKDVTRANVKEGFNSVVIQYFGPDGHKVQADLEFIVRNNTKILKLRESGIRNVVVID